MSHYSRGPWGMKRFQGLGPGRDLGQIEEEAGSEMNILMVTLARGGSKSVYKKNIAPLLGVPRP